MIRINQKFDAGNIEIIDAVQPTDIQLKIRHDHNSEFFQWFYYRVSGVQNTALTMTIMNAGQAAYADGWKDYQAVASYNQKNWFRVPTQYKEGKLTIEHKSKFDAVYYAYFTPYSLARHQQFIAQIQTNSLCRVIVLGESLQGRELDLLQIGEDDGNKQRVWITARQHPGESMAEWLVEGLLTTLLDQDSALSERLLSKLVFYIVPNMNPDGSTLGHLRTNAAGVNLNRVWGNPSLESSPEVYHVQHKMEQLGCDLFLDIHGDESLPWNFISGQKGLPVDETILKQEHQFECHLMEVNPDFQMKYGYAENKFGEESLTLASNWVGHHFSIASMTLEMPFKDNADRPNPVNGWSAERSQQLGASLLFPIAKHFNGL